MKSIESTRLKDLKKELLKKVMDSYINQKKEIDTSDPIREILLFNAIRQESFIWELSALFIDFFNAYVIMKGNKNKPVKEYWLVGRADNIEQLKSIFMSVYAGIRSQFLIYRKDIKTESRSETMKIRKNYFSYYLSLIRHLLKQLPEIKKDEGLKRYIEQIVN